MSTILKALRRLEDDKLAERPVPLDERVATPAEKMRASRRGGLVVGIASGAGVALLVLGAFVLLRPAREIAAPATGPSPEPTVAGGRPAASQRGMDARLSPVRPPPAESTIERANPEPRGSDPEPERSAVSPAQHASPEQRALDLSDGEQEVTIEWTSQALPLGSPERQALRPPPTPAATTSTHSTTASARAGATRSGAPRESIGPVEIVERAPTPPFSVTQTIWHPSPSRRVAVVLLADGTSKRLAEGEPVAGFTVGEIGPATVEFLRGGVTTSKRVGSP